MAVGTACMASAVIFIRLSALDPALLAGLRTSLAAALLWPIFLYHKKRIPEHWISLGKRALLPGIFLSLHFITWNTGARMTPASHATLIVNMAPLVMPFLLYFLAREIINRREIIGTLIGISGILLLSLSDFRLSPDHAAGDAVCFAAMLLFGFYIVLGRRNKDLPSVWLYVVPIYAICGVVSLTLGLAGHALGWIEPMVWTWPQLGYLLALVFLPTVIGHSIINWGMRHLRGQAVVVCNQGQMIFASIYAYFVFGEVPKPLFYLAAVLAITGAAIVIHASVREQRALAQATGETT